jgi:putative membrane protein
MSKRYVFSLLAFAAASAALPLGVHAQSAGTGPDVNNANSVDRQFVQQAMIANAEEIKTADAERYSHNASVRLFARTMIRDHGQSVGQLASIANQLNIPYPKAGVVHVNTSGGEPSSATNGTHVAANPAPPRTYMQNEVSDHQKAIALYENEMRNGSNQQLRSYAGSVLPQLKNHLTMAQQFMTVGRVSPEPKPTPCMGGNSC